MAKRFFSAEEACAILQHTSSEGEQEEESDYSDAEWLPTDNSESMSESDWESCSESETDVPSPAEPRPKVQARPPIISSDSDSAGEGPAPQPYQRTTGSLATASSSSRRGQRVVRQRPRRVTHEVPPAISHPQWSPSNMEVPNIPAFTARSGIQVDVQNFEPINFFQLYVNDSILDYVCEQTNLYAQQAIADNPTSFFAARWKPTNLSEMKVFWGLTLSMGITIKPQLQHYWSRNIIHSAPLYSGTMSRKRYEMLLSCLHFVNNDEQVSREDPAHDRLFKIRPLLNHLNTKYQEVYVPERQIAIDESMIPFHGRLGIKQYIPSKRSRYGVKLYKLCESGSGYTHSVRVYEGKDHLLQPAGCPPYMGTTEKIVLDLLNPMLHQGYHLYVDNFYSSIPLFKFLFSAKTPACGTVRSNRKGLPQEVVNKRLKRRELFSQRSDELLALKFKDKRDVLILSTIHTEATRTVRSGRGEVMEKPVAIRDYNKYMGAVDLADQLIATYRIDRKRKAWYKKVAVYLMQMSLVNAHIIYKKAGNPGTFLEFLEDIITSLVFESGHFVRNIDPHASEDILRIREKHFLEPLPATASKKYPQKRCKVCRSHRIRKDSRYYCPDCPSKPGLCLKPCFKIYHTLLKY
ncbi:piggyBac transposable element-derived protein 4-like [Hyperolius riggenbachi]|uniref:piggyBac transposable element-derived protein 4-like n=1 Tax=Hyperolius riggenbachi TaxID=752182 RepID=UPI0035A29FD1